MTKRQLGSSCYASPQAAARLAAKLLPPFFGPTNRSALVTRSASCNATGSAPVPPSRNASPSGHVLARAHAHEAGAEVSAGNSTGGWGEGGRGGAGGGRSFKIEFVRKCNSGAERDEYISSVAKVCVCVRARVCVRVRARAGLFASSWCLFNRLLSPLASIQRADPSPPRRLGDALTSEPSPHRRWCCWGPTTSTSHTQT